MRPSDGTWIQPQYLEVTNVANLQSYVGQTVTGTSSNTTAIIESYITQPINQNIDRKSTRLNSSHIPLSRMPSSA